MLAVLRSVLAIMGAYVSMAVAVMPITGLVKVLLAAWIGARKRLWHAAALAALVLMMSIVSSIAYGNRPPRFGGGWLRP